MPIKRVILMTGTTPTGSSSENTPQDVTALGFSKDIPIAARAERKGAEMLFLACTTLIDALSSLNAGLRVISNSILAQDLQLDKEYASQLSAVKLQTVTGNTAHKASVSAANQRAMNEQGVLQARLKAHQNKEQIDIQSATSLSTDMQQLSSVITSMMQLVSQIIASLIQMTR